MLAVAALFFFSPQLLAAIGYEFVLGNWIAYLIAAIGLASALMFTYDSMQPYAVGIHDRGITWTANQHTIEFSWADISAVRFEPKPKEDTPTILTVWTTEDIRYEIDPDITRDGYRGYEVADLEVVAESVEEIEEALRQYAGELYQPAG